VPISTLINRTCTIVKRSESGTQDELGNDVSTETTVEAVCELQQKARDEQDDQAETSDTLWNLFLLPDTDIDTGDSAVVDGLWFELVGAPWNARNPRTQQTSHMEATVRRVAGEGDVS
jgi:hypothetical protein